MSSKPLFFSGFLSAVVSSLLLDVPSPVVVVVLGWYMASVYLLLVGLLFFFSELPRVRRLLCEAAGIFAVVSVGALYPPLVLVAIPLAFYVVFKPIALALDYGVFKDLAHAALWFILSTASTTVIYYQFALSGMTALLVVAAAASLLVHYTLLRVFRRSTQP